MKGINELKDSYPIAYTVGKNLGYPECCLVAYCTDYNFSIGSERNITAQGSGFIPCEKHAKQILSGEITLESLVKDREHSLPFPQINQDELDALYDAIPAKTGSAG